MMMNKMTLSDKDIDGIQKMLATNKLDSEFRYDFEQIIKQQKSLDDTVLYSVRGEKNLSFQGIRGAYPVYTAETTYRQVIDLAEMKEVYSLKKSRKLKII